MNLLYILCNTNLSCCYLFRIFIYTVFKSFNKATFTTVRIFNLALNSLFLFPFKYLILSLFHRVFIHLNIYVCSINKFSLKFSFMCEAAFKSNIHFLLKCTFPYSFSFKCKLILKYAFLF